MADFYFFFDVIKENVCFSFYKVYLDCTFYLKCVFCLKGDHYSLIFGNVI